MLYNSTSSQRISPFTPSDFLPCSHGSRCTLQQSLPRISYNVAPRPPWYSTLSSLRIWMIAGDKLRGACPMGSFHSSNLQLASLRPRRRFGGFSTCSINPERCHRSCHFRICPPRCPPSLRAALGAAPKPGRYLYLGALGAPTTVQSRNLPRDPIVMHLVVS